MCILPQTRLSWNILVQCLEKHRPKRLACLYSTKLDQCSSHSLSKIRTMDAINMGIPTNGWETPKRTWIIMPLLNYRFSLRMKEDTTDTESARKWNVAILSSQREAIDVLTRNCDHSMYCGHFFFLADHATCLTKLCNIRPSERLN